MTEMRSEYSGKAVGQIAILVFVWRALYGWLGRLAVLHLDPRNPFMERGTVYSSAIEALVSSTNRPLASIPWRVWLRWDSVWYIAIASQGYHADDGSIIFPPLYPLAIRLLRYLFHLDWLRAALVLSMLASVGVLILLYRALDQELNLGERVAWRGVFTLLSFPTAFFLFAAYSESLFLIFALGCWLSARRQRWWLAGGLGALAVLTRWQGVALEVMLFWLLAERWRKGKRIPVSMIAAAGMPAMVLLGYMGFLSLIGLGSITQAYVRYWGMNTVLPWTGVYLAASRVLTTHLLLTDWVDLVLLLLSLLGGWLGWRWLPAELMMYWWTSIALMMMRDYNAHPLAGFSRYMLSLFPGFLLFALVPIKTRTRWIVSAVSLTIQIVLAYLFFMWAWVS